VRVTLGLLYLVAEDSSARASRRCPCGVSPPSGFTAHPRKRRLSYLWGVHTASPWIPRIRRGTSIASGSDRKSLLSSRRSADGLWFPLSTGLWWLLWTINVGWRYRSLIALLGQYAQSSSI